MRPVDPVADPRWDAFVAAQPRARVWHLSAWSRVFGEAYGYAPASLALEDADGRLRGVMPLLYRARPLSGRRCISLPAVPGGGPLAETPAMEATLLAAAGAAARERSAVLRVASRTDYGELPGGLCPVEQTPSWVIDLREGLDAVRRRFGKNVARNVRRADAAGLSGREGCTEADLRAFYAAYLRTTRKHRGIPHSYRLFALARELLTPFGAFCLSLVERDGEVVAGAVDFAFGGTREGVFAGIDDRHLGANPGYALHSWVIRASIDRGLGALDLGRTTPGGSHAHFKAQWGAEPVAEYEYGPPAAARTAPAASRALGVWRRPRAVALWARAPFPVMSTAGRIFHRHL